MSIGLYSIQSSEAETLKSNGIEIKVGEDENGNKIVQIEDEDGSSVFFNNIYNKTEIDAYITAGAGIKPGDIKNLYKVNIYPTGQIKVNGKLTNAFTLEQLYKCLNDNSDAIQNSLNQLKIDATFDVNREISDLTLKGLDFDLKNKHYISTENNSIKTYNQLIRVLNQFIKHSRAMTVISPDNKLLKMLPLKKEDGAQLLDYWEDKRCYYEKEKVATINEIIESLNITLENLYNWMKTFNNLKDFGFDSSSNIKPDGKAKVITYEETEKESEPWYGSFLTKNRMKTKDEPITNFDQMVNAINTNTETISQMHEDIMEGLNNQEVTVYNEAKDEIETKTLKTKTVNDKGEIEYDNIANVFEKLKKADKQNQNFFRHIMENFNKTALKNIYNNFKQTVFGKDGETYQKTYIAHFDDDVAGDKHFAVVENFVDFLKQYFSNTSSFEDWKEWIGKNINKQKMMEVLDKIQIPFHKLDGEIENREYRFMFDGEDIVDIENPVDIGKFMDWLKEIIQNSKYTAPIQTFFI